MAIIISAIICTYNRDKYLYNAISSLCNQTLAKDLYEIIIVDNASTDKSKEIVIDFQKSGFAVKYIYEPKLGLSQARNTGVANAKGEYVAFLDDDAIASTEWLAEILKAFDTIFPKPVCVGGKVLPLWEAEKPSWFPKEVLLSLSILDRGDQERFLKENERIIGTNMSFVKRTLEEIGGFNTQLLLYGDETYVQNVLIARKLPRFYMPSAYVEHVVSKERCTERYLYNRKYDGAKAQIITTFIAQENAYDRIFIVISNLVVRPVRIVYHLLKYVSLRDYKTRRVRILHKSQIYANVGALIQTLKLLGRQIC